MSDNYSYVAEDEMLFSASPKSEPETCLGIHFESSEDRREYFRNELRKKLKDPEFRAIEGFPIGEDEDIIALSDPPYYCACPNPWIPDFIREWESQKTPSTALYKREPYAVDVSEGKNDPIYNAHTYHTKVPYKAIMRYILHYTEPGDIIYDGFAGTGMTGVAAQACGDLKVVESLGYSVDNLGNVTEKESGVFIGKVGARKAINNDLSTAASFIACNYNDSVSHSDFVQKGKKLLTQIKNKYKHYYQTLHNDGKTFGDINYCIWSDVFTCPECGKQFVYYNQMYSGDAPNVKLNDRILCPNCEVVLSKKDTQGKLTRKPVPVFVTYYDDVIKELVSTEKRVPVLINYSIGTKRFFKTPDEYDLRLIKAIEDEAIDNWVPIQKLPVGCKTQEPTNTHGVDRIYQFYTRRTLKVISDIYSIAKQDKTLNFLFGSMIPKLTTLNRYMPQHGSRALVGPLANTLYIPPISAENNVIHQLEFQFNKIAQIVSTKTSRNVISTQGMQSVEIGNNSIDYIYLDPPFGHNIMYSELNYIRESWLNVITNNEPEAIENEVQGKGVSEYYSLMKECFGSAFKALKPGHWMTVEFSNTQAEIWNSIQLALNNVGFIIASVTALDKQRGGLHAMIGPTSVKQDLVISLYKPDESFEQQITTAVGTEAVWTFVRKHLEYLPLVKKQGETSITVPERDPRIIYDRMVSYFVGHNMLLPISSPDFLSEMPRRFAERNGLYYLPDQVQEYDRLVMRQMVKTADLETSLFVCDEKSAISWIRTQLKEKPMTLGELTPLFLQELSSSWTKGERKPELRELLEQNFLCYNGIDDVPSQVHSYLSTNFKDLRSLSKDNPALREKGKGRWYIPDPNKAGDLEKIREKALLKEFSIYESSKGKIKEFRIEAIRAGFKKAWQDKNYALIKNICERMPSAVVEEDEKLLMWYSNSLSRLGE